MGKKTLREFLCVKVGLIILLVGFMSYADANAATVFSDGSFAPSDWTQTVYTYNAGGTQTWNQQSSGGNPDNYLYITDTAYTDPSDSSAVWGIFLNGIAIYNPSISGPVSTIDYAEDAKIFGNGWGEGQASFPLIQQSGNWYITPSYFSTNYVNWTHLNRAGLQALDFVQFDQSTFQYVNSSHPDFSSTGSVMSFGFVRANGTSAGGFSYTMEGGIDNWQFTINSGQPVPEPATMLLLGLGLVGLAGIRRKIKK